MLPVRTCTLFILAVMTDRFGVGAASSTAVTSTNDNIAHKGDVTTDTTWGSAGGLSGEGPEEGPGEDTGEDTGDNTTKKDAGRKFGIGGTIFCVLFVLTLWYNFHDKRSRRNELLFPEDGTAKLQDDGGGGGIVTPNVVEVANPDGVGIGGLAVAELLSAELQPAELQPGTLAVAERVHEFDFPHSMGECLSPQMLANRLSTTSLATLQSSLQSRPQPRLQTPPSLNFTTSTAICLGAWLGCVGVRVGLAEVLVWPRCWFG
jgi:hypothetical protein